MELTCFGEFLPEKSAHDHPFGETVEVEFFVRRMGIVVGQSQAQEESIDAQMSLELLDDRDRATLAFECGRFVKGESKRAQYVPVVCRFLFSACVLAYRPCR